MAPSRRTSRCPAAPALVVALAAGLPSVPAADEAGGAPAGGIGTSPEPFEWSTDLEAALRLSEASGRPVVLAFMAGWCTACRRFEEVTRADPSVLEVADAFHWVKVDIDRDISLARSYGVTTTPTFHLIDPNGYARVLIRGYLPPQEFRVRLDGFLEDLYTRPLLDEEEPVSEFEGDRDTPLTWAPDEESYRGRAICFSNVGYGPLHLPSQSPFQSLRFGLVPRTPSTLARGDMEVRWTETWVNVWANEPGEYLLDYEMLRSSISFSYGLTDTLQLEAAFVDRTRFGGAMDGFIQGFHDAFGISQNGRDRVPKNDFTLFFAEKGSRPEIDLGSEADGSFARSFVFAVQHNVTCGDGWIPAISYAATLETDVGPIDDLDGGGDVDFGGSLAVSKRLWDVYLYSAFGFNWFGEQTFRGIPLRSTQFSILNALEWRFASNMSLIVQYLISEGVAKDLGDFSKLSHEIALGLKAEIVPGTVLELGLIENVITFDNSPDFGIHFGLSFRF